MNRLTEMVRRKMTDGGANPLLSVASFLYLISVLYGKVTAIRAQGYHKGLLRTRALPCKVVSIGNLTVGGTGKTPMVMFLAKFFQRLEYRTVVISRGYKGHAEMSGGVVSDGHSILMGVEEAGDEPFMMAMELPFIPVLVGRNRFKAGLLALEKFKPDVIVLDDAFQHLQLARDLNLVLLDGLRPFGNSHLLPRGLLREPVGAMMRSDAIILTRSTAAEAATDARLLKLAPGRPIFRSFHVPRVRQRIGNAAGVSQHGMQPLSSADCDALKEKGLYAFSGIAQNENFKKMLRALGYALKGFAAFPDHHRFTDAELNRIKEAATAAGCSTLGTTAKDFARISDRIDWPGVLLVFSIETSFGDEQETFERFVERRLKGK